MPIIFLTRGIWRVLKKVLKIALGFATIISLTQLIPGHSSADGGSVNQPAKLADIEGHY